MVDCLGEVEYAKLLVGQTMTGDTVAVKNAGMGRQTREDCGTRVAFCPIEYIRQGAPVRFFLQVSLARLSARNNHAVKMTVPKFVEAVVEAVQVTLPAVSARNGGKGVEFQVDRKLTRCVIKKVKEL